MLFCRSFNLHNFKHSMFLFPQYPEGFLEAQAKKEEEKKKLEKVKEQEKESGKGKGKGKGKRKRSEGRFNLGIKDDSPFTKTPPSQRPYWPSISGFTRGI